MKTLGMYLKSGLIHLNKNRVTSIFLIIGFSLGMAVSLFAIIAWNTQNKYDKRITNPEKLWRITTELNGGWNFATAPFDMFEDVKSTIPADGVYQLIPLGKKNIRTSSESKDIFFENAAFVTNGFIQRMNFDLLEYEDIDLEKHPEVIFITSKLSQTLFGKGSAMGQVVNVADFGEFTVRGVINSEDYNFHVQEDFYISSAKIEYLLNHNKLDSRLFKKGNYTFSYLYVDLNKEGEQTTNQSLDKLALKYFESLKGSEIKSIHFVLQPIDRIFSDRLTHDTEAVFSQPNASLLLITAFILLLVSAVNYFNIQLFSSLKRMKEFGIRKVHGARAGHIYLHIITENILVSFGGLLVAFLLIWELPIPRASEILANSDFDAKLILMFVFFAVLVGLITGVIPAHLIAKRTVTYSINSGPLSPSKEKFSLSTILLIFQLFVTVLFIFNFLLVEKQTKMISENDYGYNVEQVLMVSMKSNDKAEVLKNEILKDVRVTEVSYVSTFFGHPPDQVRTKFLGKDQEYFVNYYSSDESFLKIYNLELLSGNNFTADNSNSKTIILNEKAIDLLGLTTAEALQKELILEDSSIVTVKGIIKDFNYDNLKREIQPLMIRVLPQEYKYLNVRISKNADEDLFSKELEKKIKAVAHIEDAQVSVYAEFLKDRMSYSKDRMTLGMISMFVILMTCIGLIGVIMSNSERTKKNVAISKLCGASSSLIVFNIVRQYVGYLAIALLIALPISYYIGDLLLSEFVYKVNIDSWHFIQVVLLCILIVVLIAITQVYHYFKMTVLDGLKRE